MPGWSLPHDANGRVRRLDSAPAAPLLSGWRAYSLARLMARAVRALRPAAAKYRQLGRDPRNLALVSSASSVHAAASRAQGSKGPSASRRQWSACVLYVSASSSKRSDRGIPKAAPPAFRSWEHPRRSCANLTVARQASGSSWKSLRKPNGALPG